jgi:dUTP pyrophosphatase
MPEQQLFFKKLSPNAVTPTRGSKEAAGLDLSSIEECMIPGHGKALIGTGLSFAIPSGYYGRVAPRSGMSVKSHCDVGAGVVDSDYRGEVKVLLFNLGPGQLKINPGDRIAQLILEKILVVEPIEVKGLDATVRGSGGFGSTGVSADPGRSLLQSPGVNFINPTSNKLLGPTIPLASPPSPLLLGQILPSDNDTLNFGSLSLGVPAPRQSVTKVLSQPFTASSSGSVLYKTGQSLLSSSSPSLLTPLVKK